MSGHNDLLDPKYIEACLDNLNELSANLGMFEKFTVPKLGLEVCKRKAVLWSSNAYDPEDYYADKLELWENIDDHSLSVRLKVGGEVIWRPLVKKMEGK